MSILSNHATASVVKVQGEIDVKDLARARELGKRLPNEWNDASVLAQVDIHRAATHNKGVMNGIHAVVLATGNDTRGAEASMHTQVKMVNIVVLQHGDTIKNVNV